jgi:hypothetical protein
MSDLVWDSEWTDDDALAAILEHLRRSVDEGSWFELQPEAAKLLLAYITGEKTR